jgi:hypothetical protein
MIYIDPNEAVSKFILIALLGVLFLVAFLIGMTIGFYTHESSENPSESKLESLVTIQGNSIEALHSPITPSIRTYATLIECLEHYESTDNPNAVGKAGEIGCMQFMPSTWQLYCVDQYGYTDIWNCDQQKDCCDEMLEDGFYNVNHWTTKHLCVKVAS